MEKLSIVTLMGLPASGKSKLADTIQSSCEGDPNTLCVTLRYDDLVPLDVQKEFVKNNQAAKILRKNFVHCVQWVASCLFQGMEKAGDLARFLSAEANHLVPQDFMEKKTRDIISELDGKKSSFETGYLIVDDNNYYSSMRNELYQIAKKLECSFCVLYLKCEVEESVKRNLARSEELQVASQVIEDMSKKLEEPNPMENPCDLFCVQITQTEPGVVTESVKVLLQHSLQNPVIYVAPPDRSEDRRICSESELHQADLILRKWISSQMTICAFTKPPAARKDYSKELTLRKSVVLQKLRSGELKLSAQVSQDIEFYNEVVSFAKAVDVSAV